MSQIVDNLYNLVNNPFIFAEFISEFYHYYNNSVEKNNFLLAYLILPIILHEKSKNRLYRSKKNLNRFFYSTTKEESAGAKDLTVIAGIQKRVEHYKDLTNISIQLCIDKGIIKIDENTNIIFLQQTKKKSLKIITNRYKSELNASKNLAKLFSSYKISDIFIKFGVMKI